MTRFDIGKLIEFVLIMVFVWVMVSVICVFFFWYYDSTKPDVYWSISKDECVKIVHHGVELNCSELSEEYNKIWVK